MLKGYAIKLKYGLTYKTLYFQGEDDPETENKWQEACNRLNEIGDNSSDAADFIAKAVECFKGYGFSRIQK